MYSIFQTFLNTSSNNIDASDEKSIENTKTITITTENNNVLNEINKLKWFCILK